MDKELPWLADNAQLELKYKKGKTPLSHRNWPGEPVPVITENIIQTLGDELLQKAEKKTAIAIGQANRYLLSLKTSFRHWVMNCYKKQRRKKTLSGVMKTFHWSGSPPSRRPST
ncbi:regulator [Escherichia coli]|nr:regulator [Escherichia coli]HEA7064993.1 regulator [Escherichia coli]